MSSEHTLLQLLVDGHFHSGKEMGDILGVSRTSVWKHVKALEEKFQLDIQAVQGRGYRLSNPMDLLDSETIRSAVEARVPGVLGNLEVFDVLDSTNRYLMDKAGNKPEQASVVLAEMQTAGRGRRGRQWVSPFACNIYLSLLWRYDSNTQNLSGLSLAIGVAVARALKAAGASDISLKWPNDIYWKGRKLGGILLELNGEAGGPCCVVAGLGLNVNMSQQPAADIDQAWTDLLTVLGQRVSRNSLVVALLCELLPAMQSYAKQGLSPFLSQWKDYDMLMDKPVTLLLPQQQRAGIARGINEQGALQFEAGGKLESVFAGEVSLRPVASGIDV